MSANNSEWLKAYEAQKAKALERLSAAKNGANQDPNVTGLSGFASKPAPSEPKKGPIKVTPKPQVQSPISKKSPGKPHVCEDSSISANKPKEKELNVARMMKEVKNDSKLGASDWHKQYEERRKAVNEEPSISDIFNAEASRRPSVDNKIHEDVEQQKLNSILAFQKPVKRKSQPEKTPVEPKKPKDEKPNVARMMKEVKTDSKLGASDWHKQYEERKKAALEKLKK